MEEMSSDDKHRPMTLETHEQQLYLQESSSKLGASMKIIQLI